MSRTETKGLSERERQGQNRIPVVAQKFFPWALNCLLFLQMRIFKSWFNRFFLCSGMRIEFLWSTGINLYSFGHKERVNLFVYLFSSKM